MNAQRINSSGEAEELIGRKDWNGLNDYLVRLSPPDGADLLERLAPENALLVFRLLPRELAGDVFAELEPSAQEALIRKMTGY